MFPPTLLSSQKSPTAKTRQSDFGFSSRKCREIYCYAIAANSEWLERVEGPNT